MQFMEALVELKKCHYVTRNSWTDGSYLAFMPGMQYIWRMTLTPSPAAGAWMPMVCDLDADDWIGYVSATASNDSQIVESNSEEIAA